MIKHIFGLAIILSSLIGKSQTFTKAAGAIVGNQTVMNIPPMTGVNPNGQILVYYPDDYFTKPKPRPVVIFAGGDGEENSVDITQLNNQSLPYLISQGLKPWNLGPAGDTIKWLVISLHDNAGQVYTYPQTQYIIPWILDKAGFKIDTNCIWFTGLSGGGSSSWSQVMGNKVGDTTTGKRLTGIMPMANGGYDNWIGTTGVNAASLFKSGLSCLYIIGDQDAGYNKIGYFAYDSIARKYAKPGHYFTRVVAGGTHSANVWNIPFPLANKVWPTSTLNTWELMYSLRKNPVTTTPPPVVVTPPPTTLPYPVRIVIKYSDSSCSIIYQHP